jgi:hypothetical protein
LAPRPWAAVERDKTNAKVSAAVFADSAAEATGGEVSSQARVSHARSSVGSTSGISSSFLEAGNGYRFWALAVDESSDDELSPLMERFPSSVGQAPPACSTPAVQCKLSQGLGAPTERMAGGFNDLGRAVKTYRKPGGSGRLLEPHPKLMRRQRPVCKPWRGPLPPARSPRLPSLGDFGAVDRRAGGHGTVSKLAEICDGSVSSPSGSVSPVVGKTPWPDPILNFVRWVPVSL